MVVTDLTPGDLRQVRGRRIGTILQDPLASLNPVHRIARQVAEPLRVHGLMPRGQATARAVEMLGHVGIADPGRRAHDYPHQFSGGMRQRIVGAAAVICSPELLIADEPTTALDVTAQAAYLDLLERLQEETHAGMLFITHDLNVVRRLADRVVVMYGGRIMEAASRDEIFSASRHPYTMGLLNSLPTTATARGELLSIQGSPPDPAALPPGCPFAPRCPAHRSACDESPPSLMAVDPGHQVACIRAGELLDRSTLWPATRSRAVAATSVSQTASSNGSHPLDSRPALALDDVVMDYGSGGRVVRALDQVSLRVGGGASLAIVGESGSGKTTSARLLLGLEKPTAGRATFHGKDILALSRGDQKRYRRAVQAVFQDPFSSLNPRMTIEHIVAEPLRELAEEGHSQRDRKQRVDAALHDVGLDPTTLAATYPHQLSGGQRQRVAIARAMVVNPGFLILDEPVSSLDVSVRAQVMNLLRDIKAEHGTSFVTISHDLPSVRYLSSEIVVMYRGRVVEVSDTDALFAEPRHPYTRQLLHDALLDEPGRRRKVEQNPATAEEVLQARAKGCSYFETCPIRMSVCASVKPELVQGRDGRSVACHAFGPEGTS
jgi:peptide/nickel transport system ATP-binding protein